MGSDRKRPVLWFAILATGLLSPPGMAADHVESRYRSGNHVFFEICTTCHTHGMRGAPRLANTEEWAPRIAQGEETLYRHAIHGLNKMPPRGGCPDCTDADIRAAVNFMVEHSR